MSTFSERQAQTSVVLTDEQKRAAAALGDGNVSLGLRAIVQAYVNRQKGTGRDNALAALSVLQAYLKAQPADPAPPHAADGTAGNTDFD